MAVASGVNDWADAVKELVRNAHTPRLDENEWRTSDQLCAITGKRKSLTREIIRGLIEEGKAEKAMDWRESNLGWFKVPVYRLKK
jgi:hypothetical protein